MKLFILTVVGVGNIQDVTRIAEDTVMKLKAAKDDGNGDMEAIIYDARLVLPEGEGRTVSVHI